ncbi:pilus assembly protein [Aeoliella sp. ICT_H6.2]|uniref:Pilus assembly protein n=1 Tax=Aeoliella straminimaris TaxID=2954799 RepID=A0A9X2FBS4_9BACT|nr:TadE/TadG family type IV pilus assembly protein [Aeoliella straminimaris]MCO6045263.1 pilus assembly protein [Aeoliella straminimaris]
MIQVHQKTRKPGRRGAVIVEFAICAPVFFLVALTMFEFSWLNVIRHTADNAAYEAARVAMVPGATAPEAIAEAQRIMAVVGARGTQVTVDPPNLGPSATQVTVTVSVPIDGNMLVTPRFTGGRQIVTSSTLRTERAETR